MSRYWCWAAALLIGLQVAGCYTDFGPVAVPSEPIPAAYISTRLHVGDRIRVIVYGEENLNGVFDVFVRLAFLEWIAMQRIENARTGESQQDNGGGQGTNEKVLQDKQPPVPRQFASGRSGQARAGGQQESGRRMRGH